MPRVRPGPGDGGAGVGEGVATRDHDVGVGVGVATGEHRSGGAARHRLEVGLRFGGQVAQGGAEAVVGGVGAAACTEGGAAQPLHAVLGAGLGVGDQRHVEHRLLGAVPDAARCPAVAQGLGDYR
jgi:hypothetical protein